MAATRPAASPALPVTPGTYAGLFLVTLSTLMYEIALTRIFSVTMWYHFAFVAISVALFGMTLGALIVHLAPDRFKDADLKEQLWRVTLLFAVSIAVCFLLQLTIPFTPRWNLAAVASVVFTCMVISVPFVFSGIVVCLALTRFPARVNRLYAADLVGAALGCLLLVVLMNQLDGPSAIIMIAAVAATAALVFAWDAGNTPGMWRAVTAMLILGGFALANSYTADQRNPMLRIIWAKEEREPLHQYEKWNSYSRVTVNGDPNEGHAPFGWGMSSELPEDIFVNQLNMTIDGSAATVLTRYRGTPEETDFLRYDITNLGHYITDDGDVFIVGIGGGRDILSALEFEQNSITGVEINQAILDTTNGAFGDFTGHLDRNPKVTVIKDEARSYLERTDERYDLIQISLIDTWAATAAGAYALSENTLYTTDAWNTFLDRLKPGGVLSVSRWYGIGGRKPLETYRMTALGAQVLKDRGVDNPREHMAIYRGANGDLTDAATLLISPQPISPERQAIVAREAARLKFIPILTPDVALNDDFAGLVSPEGPGAVIDSFNEDISAPSDNRPFFFQMADLGSVFNGTAFDDSHVMRPALTLGVLGFAVIGMAALFIMYPLLRTTRRHEHEGMTPFYTYFAGIGLGFLLIEVSQLQRLSIFLGHPTYALTVVLFSVLLSSGIGSMLTEQIVRPERRATLIAPLAVLLAIVAAFGLFTPSIIDAMSSETTPVRIMVAAGILMPLGLVMGMPFAIGMRAAGQRPGAPTAFLWGINGATSVCASVLGMVIALLWGISVAYWFGVFCYVAAAASMLLILRPQTAPATSRAIPRVSAEPKT